MELQNWQGVLPNRSPPPFSPFPSQFDVVASFFLLFGVVVEVGSSLPSASALTGLWPFELASVCQQSVGRTVSTVVSTGKCSLGSCDSLSGAAVMISHLHRNHRRSRHPLSQEGALPAAGVHQCRGLLQVPRRPGSFVTALAAPVRGVGVELSVGNTRSIPCKGTKLEGEQLWNSCCAGEGFSTHSPDQEACLLDMLFVFVYCQECPGTLLVDKDLCCVWNCVNMWCLQHHSFLFSHPLPYNLCTGCKAWGNRKVRAVGKRQETSFLTLYHRKTVLCPWKRTTKCFLFLFKGYSLQGCVFARDAFLRWTVVMNRLNGAGS